MIYKQFLFLLIFATAVYGLYFVIPAKYRYLVLLFASMIFSFVLSGAIAAFTLLAALFTYVFARVMTKTERDARAKKSALSKDEFKALKKRVKKKNSVIAAVAIMCVLAILLVLKYISFFEEIISGAAGIFGANLNLPVLKFALPLGISYYTLSSIGYLIDVKRGKYSAEENFFKLALFLFYFPALLEGPVARYDVTGKKLSEAHSFDFGNLKRGILLILFGLFKKLVVADRLAILVSAVFSSYADYSGVTVLLSVIAFTFQLYAEFSGIIDIAAGVSKMYGISLEKNFDHPFFSTSVGEFWRRWHISLGSWFKDYVFYPLSMSPMSKKLSSFLRDKKLSPFLQTFLPSLISLFAVWSLTGLWHGASVKYLVYGLYYYAIMMLETLFAHIFAGKKFLSSKPYKIFAWARTFILVNIGMLIFRADNLSTAFDMFVSVFSFAPVHLTKLIDIEEIAVVLVALVLLLVAEIYGNKGYGSDVLLKKKWVVQGIAIAAFAFLIIIFGAYGEGYVPPDPIYGGF